MTIDFKERFIHYCLVCGEHSNESSSKILATVINICWAEIRYSAFRANYRSQNLTLRVFLTIGPPAVPQKRRAPAVPFRFSEASVMGRWSSLLPLTSSTLKFLARASSLGRTVSKFSRTDRMFRLEHLPSWKVKDEYNTGGANYALFRKHFGWGEKIQCKNEKIQE